MRLPKKQGEPEQAPGAPEWMVTFSDCMTLLLTFFVLLLSFSAFDAAAFRRMKQIFSMSLFPSKAVIEGKEDTDAFLPTEQFSYAEEDVGKGSEKPTLERGSKDNLKQETEPTDFHNRKVFLVPSERIFWGKGTAISRQGRNILSIMASFLKEVPNRVVVSENLWGGGKESNQTSVSSAEPPGLLRAWAVIEYLTTAQGLDKKQFSISAASTVTAKSLKSGASSHSEAENKRVLEIVLLERDIYN